jgi:tetratricopeptide (TPR) repeat protein
MRGLRAIAIVLVFAGAARAQADDGAAAREHSSRGMKAYDLGHYAEAAKEFEAAYTAQDEPALLFNLGQAYRFSGDYAAAIRSFRAYLRRLPRAEKRAEVEARLAELQKLLDEQNRLKERPAPEAPPNAVPPPAQPVVPPAPPPPRPLTRPWPPARPMKIAGITLMAVGAGSLIVGGVFAGLASSAHRDANSPPNGVFDPALEDRMYRYQNLDIAFFVTGGVLAAGGLAMFLAGKLHRDVEVAPTSVAWSF